MKTIQIIILITLACTSFQPLAAGTSIKQMNTTIIADFNQTIDKDIRGLVDTDRLEIELGPYYNVIWSPEEKHALINVQLYVCPKGKGDTQSGYISALYIANKTFSNISRIAWTEFTTTEYGKIIESPSWSQSGDHFAYEELTEGKMYTIKSAQLFVVSTDLQQVQQIEMDNKMLHNYNYPLNYKWSPVEEILAVPIPGKLVVYDPAKENNLTFDIDNDISNIDHLEWSPNGKNIAFLEGQDGHKDIVGIDIDQKERHLMYSVEDIGMYDTLWSPDSQKLVFYTLNGTDENGETCFDIYIMDKNTNTTEKINLKRSSYWVVNWYPDSERLLVVDASNGSSKLCSISITGDQKVLLDGVGIVEVHLGPDDYTSVLDTDTSKLVVFNDSYKQDFSNVTGSTWINNDLMFTTNSKTSILNTSTNTIWEIPRSAIYPYMISISPQEHFIAINNTILEMNYGNSPGTITKDQKNDSASQVTVLNSSNNQDQKVNTTAASQAPGFSVIQSFAGIAAVLVFMYFKKWRGD
jgi:Tol biopolymer transport system component